MRRDRELRSQGGAVVNWLDEGALYSSIGLFLREDLGRGDVTTQATLMRNVRARGRFVAGEKMVVAGLEAAEEVFITLDPQQQIEAFAGDGEEVEAGKVIARTSGFADVLLAGERVALNLLRHLSGVATTTREFARAVEGTKTKIADTRKTTPGLRMLEKYAVLLGGGVNHRSGLDDGIFVKTNHAALVGEYLFEELARIPVEVEYASEFRYRNPPMERNTIVLTITQSGANTNNFNIGGFNANAVFNMSGGTIQFTGSTATVPGNVVVGSLGGIGASQDIHLLSALDRRAHLVLRHFDFQVRLDAPGRRVVFLVNAASARQVIVTRRELQIRRAVAQREKHLHASLAEGALADDQGPLEVLERSGNDFTGAGGILVDQHH